VGVVAEGVYALLDDVASRPCKSGGELVPILGASEGWATGGLPRKIGVGHGGRVEVRIYILLWKLRCLALLLVVGILALARK
jgi:hypothetical protein